MMGWSLNVYPTLLSGSGGRGPNMVFKFGLQKTAPWLGTGRRSGNEHKYVCTRVHACARVGVCLNECVCVSHVCAYVCVCEEAKSATTREKARLPWEGPGSLGGGGRGKCRGMQTPKKYLYSWGFLCSAQNGKHPLSLVYPVGESAMGQMHACGFLSRKQYRQHMESGLFSKCQIHSEHISQRSVLSKKLVRIEMREKN